MIDDDDRRFLATHRLCVVGTSRTGGSPALSPVFYVLDGDDVLISITTDRHKYRAISSDPNVSLCVLDEEFPFSYLTVYGRGAITADDAAETMERVSGAIVGRPLTDDERAGIARRVVDEHRVSLRVTLERVVRLGPPRASG